MYSALSFIIIFCILYYFIYLIIKKINPNLGIGDTINLGLLLIAVITISVTIYSFNGWKSQHYLNNKEKLLTQISDQLEKTNNQVQTTQRLLSYFINDSKLTSREAIRPLS